jgi:predicted nucleic acid-binding protein
MTTIFIDANIFLNFYHFSNEDLENLEQLSALVQAGHVSILLPTQVVSEFARNRESKIKDSLNRISANDRKAEIPQMIKDYPESAELKSAETLFRDKKNKLLERLNKEISSNSLKADMVIKDLFSLIDQIITTDEVLAKAVRRVQVGNPPGKNGSIGDAINWEVLLTAVQPGTDLHFISEDSDYTSKLDSNKFMTFLLDEWHQEKGSKIIFFKSLNQFLKDLYPNIKITTEDIKDAKITAFAQSSNFDAARARLASLMKLGQFSNEQILNIVRASISNNQIYWAHNYSPELVGQKLEKIIAGSEISIPYDEYKIFCDHFDIEPILRVEDLEF